MLEWPFIQEIIEEKQREQSCKNIASTIRARQFEPLDDNARARLQGIGDDSVLEELLTLAVICKDRETFMARLLNLPPPAPRLTSTRRKRKT